MASPDPVRGFFGATLVAVGLLMMFLCGGVPALVGFGLFFAGRTLRRAASEPKPPPSAPPPG